MLQLEHSSKTIEFFCTISRYIMHQFADVLNGNEDQDISKFKSYRYALIHCR